MKKNIAILFPFPILDSVPSLCNAAELLAQAGYQIDFYIQFSPEFLPPTFQSKNIRLIPLYTPSWMRKGLFRFIPFWRAQLLEIYFTNRKTPYRAVIAVDGDGLIKAHSLFYLTKTPIIFYSLEMTFFAEIGNRGLRKIKNQWIKNQEIKFSQQVTFTVVQDIERADLLQEENNIPQEKMVLVPNSPMGREKNLNTNYWHIKFGLQANQRVVLHAGSAIAWTGLQEIVKSVTDWPENWVLVIHTKLSGEQSEYLNTLKQISPKGRVYFSLSPVPREEYDELVESADIGIAFYLTQLDSLVTQQNIETIGLSSGKIAYYLRAGLPVIINQVRGLPDLIEKEQCGVIVGDTDEIAHAISQIEKDYQKYSAAAVSVFDEHLDFSRPFRQVIQNIDTLPYDTN